MKIIISDESHPHAGETGLLTGDVIIVLGTPMAHVLLDNCKHGTDGCYVSKGQITEVKMYAKTAKSNN